MIRFRLPLRSFFDRRFQIIKLIEKTILFIRFRKSVIQEDIHQVFSKIQPVLLPKLQLYLSQNNINIQIYLQYFSKIIIQRSPIIYMYSNLNCISDFALIPKEAFLFKPQRANRPEIADDYRRFQGKMFRRLIFQGWAQDTYTPAERQSLAKFQHYIRQKGIKLDERWDDPWRLRFLLSTDHKFDTCLEQMQVFMGYMNRVQQLSFTPSVAKNLRSGMFYIVGRDSHYRPIVVINSQKIVQANLSEEESLQTQIYFFEYIMRHYFIPGQVQSWVAIIDSAYQGFFNLITSLQSAFKFLADTYRMRLYCCYNVRINFAIKMVWEVAKRFLDDETVCKINLVQEQQPEQLFAFTNRSQVEVRYGGTLPNFEEGHFWPPRAEVSSDYEVPGQEVQKMTPEEYTELHQKGVLRDTRIHEELLVKPVQENAEMVVRQNGQKHVVKKIERQFELQLEEVNEETVNLQPLLQQLQKHRHTINYLEVQSQSKPLILKADY